MHMHVARRHSEVVRDPPGRDKSRAAGVQPGNLSNFTTTNGVKDDGGEAAGVQRGAVNITPVSRNAGVQPGNLSISTTGEVQ
jgi:hypothetical protein